MKFGVFSFKIDILSITATINTTFCFYLINIKLRRLPKSLTLIGSAMFGATFNLVTRVGSTVIFGTRKGYSLQINSLAFSRCFSYRNVFQNGVNALSKLVLKNSGFLSKSSKFRVVWTIRFCSNLISMWYKHFLFFFLRNVWRNLRLPMSALAAAARKSFNSKFTAKIDFPIGHFILPLLMLT